MVVPWAWATFTSCIVVTTARKPHLCEAPFHAPADGATKAALAANITEQIVQLTLSLAMV
jgi:hypothetical protein